MMMMPPQGTSVPDLNCPLALPGVEGERMEAQRGAWLTLSLKELVCVLYERVAGHGTLAQYSCQGQGVARTRTAALNSARPRPK